MDFSIQKVALGMMFSAMLVACGGSGEPIVDQMPTSASSDQKIVATAEIATDVPSSTPIEPTEVVIPATAVIKVTQEEVKEVKASVTNTMEAPSPTVPVPTTTAESKEVSFVGSTEYGSFSPEQEQAFRQVVEDE